MSPSVESLTRVARDTAIACGLMAEAAALWRPGSWQVPLGVVGGGLLVGVSFWAIWGGVEAWTRPRREGGSGAGFRLVKFFTRYAILAVAAYGMMVRLHLDPVGMLAGVTSLVVAAGLEAVRGLRWRRFL